MGKRTEKKPPEPKSRPWSGDAALDLSTMLKREESPLNDAVWRAALHVLAGSAAAWLLVLVGVSRFTLGIWVVAAVAGLSWYRAVRLIFLETKLKKFWIVWLSLSLLFVLFSSHAKGVWAAGVVFSFFFLLFRKYKPYRHLSSKRRALLFLLSFAAFFALSAFWRLSHPALAALRTETSGGTAEAAIGLFPSLGLNIASYSVWSLRFFFVFSMLSLFLSVRLHFLKIKPKLAVSAFLLIMVPVGLLVIMELVVLYSVLGESRAVRTSAILKDWAAISVEDDRFPLVLSGETHRLEPSAGPAPEPNPSPEWAADFLRLAGENPGSLEQAVSDASGFYLWNSAELWLMTRLEAGGGATVFRAMKVDQKVMDRLAGLVQADVIITVTNPISIDRLTSGRTRSVQVDPVAGEELRGRYDRGPEGDPAGNLGQAQGRSLWSQRFYFGMTHLDVVMIEPGGFRKISVLLSLKSSVADIINEVFSARNPLGIAFAVGILTVAALMLLFEIFALVFGLRVVGGITSAVKALHAGTRRIAAGDLETKTTIPNEDELGDLALAFNEMSAAVKKGREEAVAREKLERELKVAREIQERLLPHDMPDVPGFEISGTSLPSQQISGDYFDFLEMESGRVGIAIADVSGKGIPAALLMANLQASLHGQAVETGEAAKVVSKINDLLARSTDSYMFATFFYGVLDRIQSTFTFSNAGHNPPFLFHPDGSFERMNPGGLLIGFMARQDYEQQTLSVGPGDVLVLFTDGITEAVRPGAPTQELKYFGEERLVAVVRECLDGSAGEIQGCILGAVSSHMAGAPPADDITLVVIRRRPEGG